MALLALALGLVGAYVLLFLAWTHAPAREWRCSGCGYVLKRKWTADPARSHRRLISYASAGPAYVECGKWTAWES